MSQALRLRLLVYGGLLVMLWFSLPALVRKITYPAPSTEVLSPPPSPIEEVYLRNKAGQRLLAWYLPCRQINAPILVFFHGNGQDLGNMLSSGFLHRLSELGVHLLAVEYPGYGGNEGQPGEQVILEAGALAMDWVLANHPEAVKLIAGWSLGAAVAVQISKSYQGHHEGLILMSPWTSIDDVARVHYPGWMVRLLMKESYPSLVAARQIAVRSLVIHGVNDGIIPIEQAATLAQALGEQQTCQFIKLAGHAHNDLLGSELCWTHLSYFINQFTQPEH